MVRIETKPVRPNAIINTEKFETLKEEISKTLFEIEKNQYVFVSYDELSEIDAKQSKVINSFRKFFNLKLKGIEGGIGITSVRIAKTVEPVVVPEPEPEKKSKKKD